MIRLIPVFRSHPRMLWYMRDHYSQPRGFVGRNLCYLITWNWNIYGAIAGGSATRFLPGRNEFFGVDKSSLQNVINNIFFHVEKQDSKYPCRQFVPKVLAAFREKVALDWVTEYGDEVVGFESLVELPRTGDCYKQDGWTLVGQTKGYTCKRTAGKGTDSWSGKRVWDTQNLRPKLVFVRRR